MSISCLNTGEPGGSYACCRSRCFSHSLNLFSTTPEILIARAAMTPVYYVVITGPCVPCPENTSHDLRLPSIPSASCHSASASRSECSRSPRVHSGYGFQRFHRYVTTSQLQIHMLDEVMREFWRGEPFSHLSA